MQIYLKTLKINCHFKLYIYSHWVGIFFFFIQSTWMITKMIKSLVSYIIWGWYFLNEYKMILIYPSIIYSPVFSCLGKFFGVVSPIYITFFDMNAVVFLYSMGINPSKLDRKNKILYVWNHKLTLDNSYLSIDDKRSVLLKWDVPVIVNDKQFQLLLS